MQVVEGIRIQMSTEKLHAHLARRIDYHKTKAAFYRSVAREPRPSGRE
jgi:hypothetical protein